MTDKNQGEVIGNWQGKMWETLWEVELAGYHKCLCLRVRKESFSFDYLEYLLLLFSCSVVQCLTLRTHGLQHVRLPFTSPFPGVCSNSCPLSRCCHSAISSSVFPFFSCPQSFPVSESFPMSQLFTSGGQSIGTSALANSLSSEYSGLISFRIYWFRLLAVQGTLKSLLQHHSLKASILWCSAFSMVQLPQPWMTTRKTIALTRQTFVSNVMSLFFNILSRLVIAFLTRSKHLLISWLQPSSAVIFEPKKIKSVTVSSVSSSICHEVMGSEAMILVF